MSKPAPENPSVAPATTAPSTSGAISTLEHDLLKRNVNDHVEKKQGLSYLSWAWAWQEALKADPTATFNVQTFDGKPYMDVNGYGMVWVTVSLGQRTRTCFLPVMDHRNKPVMTPDSFQINTAIMRCMTKCLALFGLGLYIYSGEDLPEGGADTPIPQYMAPPVPPPVVSKQEQDDLVLFADGLVQHIDLQKTEKDLKNYWKSNQESIDRVKEKMPDLYKLIQEKFSAAKAELAGGNQ